MREFHHCNSRLWAIRGSFVLYDAKGSLASNAMKLPYLLLVKDLMNDRLAGHFVIIDMT